MNDYEFQRMRWRKSTRCETGSCVEIALIGGGGAVRDSKNPDGPALPPVRTGWAAFFVEVKTGAFDLPG